jgi:uncharacterized protein YjdB
MPRYGARLVMALVALSFLFLALAGCPNPIQTDPPDNGSPTEASDDSGDDSSADPDSGNDGSDGATTASLTLSVSEAGVRVGRTGTFTVTVSDATTTAVDWAISNSDVFQLDSTSDTSVTVSAIAEGSATLTATLREDTAVTATADLTAYVVSVVLGEASAEPYTVSEDETFDAQSILSVLPSAYASSDVTWSSSDTATLTVDSAGQVFGESVGSATLTATSVEDPTKADTATFSIAAGSTDVSITFSGSDAGASRALIPSDTIDFGVSVTPSNRPQSVTWASSDEAVVSVSDGTVTGVAIGTATITATSTYNGAAVDSIEITVNSPVDLDGTVLESVAGAPLDGATVNLVNENDSSKTYSTSSTADGSFGVADMYPGTYTVNLSKTGYAGSRMVGLDLFDNESIVMIQRPAAFAGRSTDPPAVTVSGITVGATYSGVRTISVAAAGANPDTPVSGTTSRDAVYLNIGGTATQLSYVESSYSGSLSYPWDAGEWPAGEVVVEVVAYDTNDNRTVRRMIVNAAGSSSSPPFSDPDSYLERIEGRTFGESLGLYSVRGSLVRGSAAEPGTSSYVMARVEQPFYWYTGARLYRSTSSTGPWTIVDQTEATVYYGTSQLPDVYFELVDSSAGLMQSTEYFYELSFFNDSGETRGQDTYSLTLLPAYDLILTSPTDDSTTTNNQPTLSWSVSGVSMPAGAERTDTVLLTRPVTADIAEVTAISDGTTSLTPSSPLGSGQLYEWNVASYTRLDGALNEGASPLVYSISFPATIQYNPYLGAQSFASNGAYQFTVE